MNKACGLAIAVVVLSACDKTVATPPGVVLDVPAFTKMSVRDWTVGAAKAPPTKVTKKFHYTTDTGPDVRYAISFEHGPAELVDAKPGATPPPVQVPSAIHIELLESKVWAVTAKCDNDLKVPLEVNPDGSAAFPKSVWANCELIMKRKNGDITSVNTIDVYGDGKLEVSATGSNESVKEE
ncbi:MAG TPA: hypothetical protein VGH28_17690 [Polyangiaceae bacterium]|jgi:hypothetical protein